MTVLYIISTFENGIGGHYYSLKSTVESLQDNIQPIIINIGINESPIIKALDIPNYNIHYKNVLNLFSALRRLKEIIKENKVDFIHCFDDRAYYFTRFFQFRNIPVLLTKCGGPNPTYFPKSDNLVLFSIENLNYFQKKEKNTEFYFIPNRVEKFKCDEARINILKKEINYVEGEIILLRITRIASFYKQSIMQSVNLTNALKKKGFPVRLILIGNLIDQELLTEIEMGDTPVKVLTNKKFTINAKEYIDFSDIYIGTGRGLMEAAQKKKILFTPLADKKYPGLVNQDSFQQYFSSNFSERNQSEKSDSEMLELVNKVLYDKNYRTEIESFSLNMYEKYFDINSVSDKYLSIYKKIKNKRKRYFFDFLIHSLFIHYYLYTHQSKKQFPIFLTIKEKLKKSFQ